MSARRDLTGALCGIAAGAVAMSVASIGGAMVDGAAPPLQVLGDWVIRVTPISVTEQIIGAVGRHDKQLLLATMVLVAVLAAALIGVRYVRGRRTEAMVGIGLLAVLPVITAWSRPMTSGWRELAVLVPSGLLGAVVLRALTASSAGAEPSTAADDPSAADAIEEHAALTAAGVDRRQALTATAVLAASVALGIGVVRQLTKPSLALMSRLRAVLPLPTKPLPALVDDLASRGASPLVTPVGSFYRIDISQSPPLVDPDTWSLTVSRDGRTLAELSYDELLARFWT